MAVYGSVDQHPNAENLHMIQCHINKIVNALASPIPSRFLYYVFRFIELYSAILLTDDFVVGV
jgi:hypothetical protein